MRVVVQRVKEAEVLVKEERSEVIKGKINKGIVVLLGVGKNDTHKDVEWMAEKVANLRIFPDEEDKMNLSVLDAGGEVLVVSQFTLYGDCRKGRRPGYTDAAEPEYAIKLYKDFIEVIKEKGLFVAEGIFQESMLVKIYNQGPVTLIIDSEKKI
ncbi:MAG TPA: D-aminoacyl-tRNA deacylase [Candidatus Eremiobacteraeota bacterium]|nr:MAG: D-tyrosyl-tRNA(Tyr) deacylase [bacterium ADurb.Bin363]HPZ09619.1 D-aminoacyl-tRNA deacylase [Candidatus Eremiobacteraeota bacterium]